MNSSRDERFFDAPDGPRVRFRAMRAMRFRGPSLGLSASMFLGFLVAMALSAAWGGIEHPLVAVVVILVWALALAVAIIRGPYRRHLDRRHAEDRADGRWADELSDWNDSPIDPLHGTDWITVRPISNCEPVTLTLDVDTTAFDQALAKALAATYGVSSARAARGAEQLAREIRRHGRNGPSAYAEGKAAQGAHAALADLDSAMVTFGQDLDPEPLTFTTSAWSPPITGEALREGMAAERQRIFDSFPEATLCACPVCMAESQRMAEMVRTYPVPPEYLPES